MHLCNGTLCGARPMRYARPNAVDEGTPGNGTGRHRGARCRIKNRADQVWIVFITLTGVMRSNSTVSGIAVAPGCAFR